MIRDNICSKEDVTELMVNMLTMNNECLKYTERRDFLDVSSIYLEYVDDLYYENKLLKLLKNELEVMMNIYHVSDNLPSSRVRLA